MSKAGKNKKRFKVRFYLLAVILLLLALCGVSGYYLLEYLYTGNDYFLFQELEMTPTAHFTAKNVEAIFAEMGEKQGCIKAKTNLLAVDLRSLRNKLQENPLVASAEVQRILPGKLVVTITERIPVAQLWRNGQTLALIGADGKLFPCAFSKAPQQQLPYITGFPNDMKIKMGETIEDEGVLSALNSIQVINNSDRIPNASFDIHLITLQDQYSRMEHTLIPVQGNETMRRPTRILLPLAPADLNEAWNKFERIIKVNIASGTHFNYCDLTLSRPVTRDAK